MSNQNRIQEAVTKLNQCQRIDHEYKRTHSKLLTVYEAFKQLRTNAVRLDSATTDMLKKLPNLTSDRELQEMQQTVNRISDDVARMDDVFADKDDSYTKLRNKLMNPTTVEPSTKSSGGKLRDLRHRLKRRGGMKTTNQNEEETAHANVEENKDKSETSPQDAAVHMDAHMLLDDPKPSKNVLLRAVLVENEDSVADFMDTLIPSGDKVKRLYGNGEDALISYTPFDSVLSELQNARGRVDYTLQLMHQLYTWKNLLNFAGFNSDRLYCPCWTSTELRLSTSKKCTKSIFVEEVYKMVKEEDFSMADVYLHTELISDDGTSYQVVYYAPIWKAEEPYSCLLHVASSSVYGSEESDKNWNRKHLSFEVYYKEDLHLFQITALELIHIDDTIKIYDQDIKRKLFRYTNDEYVQNDVRSLLEKLYKPYLVNVAKVIDERNEKLKVNTRQKFDRKSKDAFNRNLSLNEWRKILCGGKE